MVASSGTAHHGAVDDFVMEWALARTALPTMIELRSGRTPTLLPRHRQSSLRAARPLGGMGTCASRVS